MKIKADLIRNPHSFLMAQCQVEKIVELPGGAFNAFLAAPLRDHPFITENRKWIYEQNNVRHCLLALCEDRLDGALIGSEGSGRALYVGYMRNARNAVNAALEWAADFIVGRGVGNTRDGSWSIHIQELEKQSSLTVRQGNGLDRMLLDVLARRTEVSGVELVGEYIVTAYHPRFCKHLRLDENAAEFSPERTAELFQNAMATILQRHEGDELYAMLHDGLGLTLREIRVHGYLSDAALTETAALPRQVLEKVVRVRDILRVDTPRDAFLTCGTEEGLLPLKYLTKLTDDDCKTYAALLDAEVTDVRCTDMGIVLTLDGVKPGELGRVYEDYEARQRPDKVVGTWKSAGADVICGSSAQSR